MKAVVGKVLIPLQESPAIHPLEPLGRRSGVSPRGRRCAGRSPFTSSSSGRVRLLGRRSDARTTAERQFTNTSHHLPLGGPLDGPRAKCPPAKGLHCVSAGIGRAGTTGAPQRRSIRPRARRACCPACVSASCAPPAFATHRAATFVAGASEALPPPHKSSN